MHVNQAELPDRELITQIRSGDPRAFENLVRQYSQRLVGFAFTFLHSEEAAKDAVSDVFSKIWFARTSWRPSGTIKHYLFLAVRNHCYNLIKHERVMSEYNPEIPESAPIDTDLDNEERDKLLLSAINTLNNQQRAVLRLKYLEGMTFKEISKVLGISTSAAEQASSRAIRALKARFRED